MPLERLACELKSKIESTWLKKKLTRKVKAELIPEITPSKGKGEEITS